MIERSNTLEAIQRALKRAPVVVLVGPRQCGKTTLARVLLDPQSPNYFDLEDPVSLALLDEPMTALSALRGLVVIDEVQRRPDLFPILRVLADRPENGTQFLVLGSASGELLRQSSESLAGRMERIEIGGFSVAELPVDAATLLWERGGFPRSYLAASGENSLAWRANFVQSLLERDFPQWGVRVPAIALRRFWTMLAHYHGQIWSAADPARALGVSENTVRRHLDLLTDAFMVRQLQPWHANLGKRQVKSPKVYLRDSGLLHQLLGISNQRSLQSHPKLGASWEGCVIEEAMASQTHDDAWFWATHQGAEIDLVLRRGETLYGLECKRVDAPKLTPSLQIAKSDLGLHRIAVIYPGNRRYTLADGIEAVPLATLATRDSLFD